MQTSDKHQVLVAVCIHSGSAGDVKEMGKNKRRKLGRRRKRDSQDEISPCLGEEPANFTCFPPNKDEGKAGFLK